MPEQARQPGDIRPGDVFEDCRFHPCYCYDVGDDGTHVFGISLLDGSTWQCHIAGCGVRKLTPAEASAAKLWHSEMQWNACDMALQLHGGAGYMNEYPIARLWRDARVARIYGGTSEIMKELIGRTIGDGPLR